MPTDSRKGSRHQLPPRRDFYSALSTGGIPFRPGQAMALMRKPAGFSSSSAKGRKTPFVRESFIVAHQIHEILCRRNRRRQVEQDPPKFHRGLPDWRQPVPTAARNPTWRGKKGGDKMRRSRKRGKTGGKYRSTARERILYGRHPSIPNGRLAPNWRVNAPVLGEGAFSKSSTLEPRSSPQTKLDPSVGVRHSGGGANRHYLAGK